MVSDNLFLNRRATEVEKKISSLERALVTRVACGEIGTLAQSGKTPMQSGKPYAIAIKSVREQLDGQSIKSKVIKELELVLRNVKIKNIRKIKNGIIIETNSKDHIKRIVGCTKIADLGMRTEKFRDQTGRCLIFEVLRMWSNTEVLNELYNKNGESTDQQKFKVFTMTVDRRKPKNAMMNLLIL